MVPRPRRALHAVELDGRIPHTARAADLVRPHQRGTAYGLYNLAFGVTVLPASLLMGALWDWRGPSTAFVFSAVVGSTAAVLLALTVRTGTKTEARARD